MTTLPTKTDALSLAGDLAHPIDDPSVDFFETVAALDNAADIAIDPTTCMTAWEVGEPTPPTNRPSLDFGIALLTDTPNDPQTAQVRSPSTWHPLGFPPAPTPVAPIGPGEPPFQNDNAELEPIETTTLPTSFETVLMREHNRWVEVLERENPHWSDKQLFDAAAVRVEVEIQAITFNELLPLLLGVEGMAMGATGNAELTTAKAVRFITAAIKFMADPGLPAPVDMPLHDQDDLEELVANLVMSAMADGLYGGEYATTIVDQFPRLFAGDVTVSHENGLSEGELAALWNTQLAELIAVNTDIDRVDDDVMLFIEEPLDEHWRTQTTINA
ncbi:MAG: hypothetical protein KI792_10975 [Alphaproteobacteria bacterium]|nr:hypothetical protein [Alphaproteobacteria bacterium SS10]